MGAGKLVIILPNWLRMELKLKISEASGRRDVVWLKEFDLTYPNN